MPQHFIGNYKNDLGVVFVLKKLCLVIITDRQFNSFCDLSKLFQVKFRVP